MELKWTLHRLFRTIHLTDGRTHFITLKAHIRRAVVRVVEYNEIWHVAKSVSHRKLPVQVNVISQR